eukprot:746656-Hanusia_phi.AAC.6
MLCALPSRRASPRLLPMLSSPSSLLVLVVLLSAAGGGAGDEEGKVCQEEAERGWITSSMPGLLGNLMFDYACLIGLADFYGFTPLLTLNNSFMQEEGGEGKGADALSRRRIEAFATWFNLDIQDERANKVPWKNYRRQKGWGRYDESLHAISDHKYIRVEAPFSYKYFDQVGRERFRDRIFVFPMRVREKAEDILRSLRVVSQKIIGIHVRRGDKTWEFHMFNSWTHDVGDVSPCIAGTFVTGNHCRLHHSSDTDVEEIDGKLRLFPRCHR